LKSWSLSARRKPAFISKRWPKALPHARLTREAKAALHWQTPGRVWAADFTEPSLYGSLGLLPIADGYPYLLAVRDLASGCMLAWQALPALTEEVTSEALAGLFARHGAPLVLKMDNGSAFRPEAFKQFLETSGVIPLYSPLTCPGIMEPSKQRLAL
jgi:transposase InsO family protein